MKKITFIFLSALMVTSFSFATEESLKLRVDITHPGTGEPAEDGQVMIVHYIGSLEDGTVFDSSRESGVPFAFTLDQTEFAGARVSVLRSIDFPVLRRWRG